MSSEDLKVGRDYKSKTDLTWRWSLVWDCWERSKHTFKIFYHQDAQVFTCSSHGVWHQGQFSTFEEAEANCLGEDS